MGYDRYECGLVTFYIQGRDILFSLNKSLPKQLYILYPIYNCQNKAFIEIIESGAIQDYSDLILYCRDSYLITPTSRKLLNS